MQSLSLDLFNLEQADHANKRRYRSAVRLHHRHHYHPDAPWDFGAPKILTRAPEVLAATVPAVNALQPDFILHGGDLFCGGTAFELPDDLYEQSLRDVAAAYSGFEAPVHYVPGNHDCRASDFSFEDLGRAFPMPGLLGIAEVAPRLRVALANVYHTGHGEGGGLWTGASTISYPVRGGSARVS